MKIYAIKVTAFTTDYYLEELLNNKHRKFRQSYNYNATAVYYTYDEAVKMVAIFKRAWARNELARRLNGGEARRINEIQRYDIDELIL